MTKLKTLFGSLLAAAAVAVPASAQYTPAKADKSEYPHMFIGLQGGAQITFTNYQASKLITPIGVFNVGGMLTPAIGARINVSGYKAKGGLAKANQTYDYKFVNTNFDLMLNLCNVFAPHKNHTINAYLIGGAGFGYAWDNEAMSAEVQQNIEKETRGRWNKDRFVHSFRVGMQLEAELGRNVGLNLEVTANNLQDRFNTKLNGKGDWQLQAMLGLNFKFAHKKKAVKQTEEVPVLPEHNEQPAPAPMPKPEPKPETEVQPQKQVVTKRIEVFYKINSSKPSETEESKLRKLAEWLKQHPEAQVELVGYADAGTGNASINMRVAQRRVNEAARLLTDKYGIEAARIHTDCKGDTVQPFSNNNDNRVVIAVSQTEE